MTETIDYNVKILADSISPDGVRLTTLQCRYPRFIHSEMLRHRVFSHSVASSRAIPTEKQIERVSTDPFIPETFNKRVKGMGVGEAFSEREQDEARGLWISAAKHAVSMATALNDLGLDKSRANRLLEPFIWVDDIITATEWDNFFALRDHPAAQPEFQILAVLMRTTLKFNKPQEIGYGGWHLPLIGEGEPEGESVEVWKKVSASRCARVSFDTHEQIEPIERSLERAEMLLQSGHLSPFEHVARPLQPGDPIWMGVDGGSTVFCGNFRGWVQMRKEIPHEENFGELLEKVEA